MITLVDSNVILDVVTNDAKWFEWSAESLSRALANRSSQSIRSSMPRFPLDSERSRSSSISCLRRIFTGSIYRTKLRSSRARHSWPIAAEAAGRQRRFPISTSARMLLWPVSAF